MRLTRSEEQVMKYLWKLEKAFFKELKEEYPEPKPATTTINTFLKKLNDKGFISYRVYGNSRQYYPLISKEQYFSTHMKGMLKNFFNSSVEQFGSFFTKEIDISDEDLKKLRKIIDERIKSKSND